MNVNWFLNPDNVCYTDAADFAAEFEKELGVGSLKEEISRFAAAPGRDGVVLDGVDKKNHVKLFVPDLHFEKPMEQGKKVWAYMGEKYKCYCLQDTDACL